MVYTLSTRARRNGFFFERHELAPLGISEGSQCWGLWVEGRGFDEKSRLDSQPYVNANESPQLGVSAIHPSFWPSAFNVNVLLERRQPEQGQAFESDSILGLTDAFVRLGLNILLVSSAQVGYDLISVNAVCELPSLRDKVAGFVETADKAGAALHAIRTDPMLWSNEAIRKSKLEAADDVAFTARLAEFQKLGQLLTPRLAELEMRLYLLNYYRYEYQMHPEGRDALVKRAAPTDASGNTVTANAHFAAIVGWEPDEHLKPEARAELVKSALSAPWFLNRKVLSAGENTYFLSYKNIDNAIAAGKHSDNDRHIVSPEVHSAVLSLALSAMKSTKLPANLETVVLEPTRPSGKKTTLKSGLAERMELLTEPAELLSTHNREFFLRQALRPVQIASLPSLAHMRFWAVGGALSSSSFVQLRYANGLLGPDSASSDGSTPLHPVFEFLNRWTRVESASAAANVGKAQSAELFGPHMAVLANINLHDHFVRLRSVRERFETKHYVTLRIPYKVTSEEARPRANPQGLADDAIRYVVSLGFRIERFDTMLQENTQKFERGTIEIVARASNLDGHKTCDMLAKGSRATAELIVLKQQLVSTLCSDKTRVIDAEEIDILLGFVQPQR